MSSQMDISLSQMESPSTRQKRENLLSKNSKGVRKRQAKPIIPASPESPRAASPLQPRASVRRSNSFVAPNLTMKLSQISHSGRNLFPQPREPAPDASSTGIIERVEPRPEKQHHCPRQDDRILAFPSPTPSDSPSGRTLRSPSPLRPRHQSSSHPVRTPFPSLPRRRYHSPYPSSSRDSSPSPPAKAISTDSDEQWRKDTERENAIFEQQGVDRGYSPEEAKNIAEDRFGFDQISSALDVSMERRRSCSEERNLKDTKPTPAEEYWTKLGYQPPPPGTDPGTRSVYLAEWVAKYGLHINLRTYMGGGGRGSSGYGRGPSTSYSGLGENHSSYQKYGPEPPMSNQDSSGSVERFVAERGNLQIDETINRLAGEIREQIRRKEEESRDHEQRHEKERRDSDERLERFKHALDEFRSK